VQENKESGVMSSALRELAQISDDGGQDIE
jgi:hypothetical protein